MGMVALVILHNKNVTYMSCAKNSSDCPEKSGNEIFMKETGSLLTVLEDYAIVTIKQRCAMKIEKISDNQIKCTLTKEDLSRRHLKVSELAYGTEKARSLFQEMMLEARYEFGFEAEHSPLMVEAIPMGGGNITLMITKVDDPEELDTRFSRFAPDFGSGRDLSEEDLEEFGADSEDLFGDPEEASSYVEKKPSFREVLDAATQEESTPAVILFTVRNMAEAMDLAAAVGTLGDDFRGESALYKAKTGEYLFALQRGQETPERFRMLCEIASEFGPGRAVPVAGQSHLREHYEVLIAKEALQKLK